MFFGPLTSRLTRAVFLRWRSRVLESVREPSQRYKDQKYLLCDKRVPWGNYEVDTLTAWVNRSNIATSCSVNNDADSTDRPPWRIRSWCFHKPSAYHDAEPGSPTFHAYTHAHVDHVSIVRPSVCASAIFAGEEGSARKLLRPRLRNVQQKSA